MNEAERLLARMFGWSAAGADGRDIFVDRGGGGGEGFFHPDVVHSLFGPSGTKELLVGRDAFFAFVGRCAEALSERRDEVLTITGIDGQCAFVHARAYRRSRANGEEIAYEWAMLYRVEDGLITYGADMLDARAQAFWGRVLTPAAGTA